MRRYANNERANLANVSIHASVKDATTYRERLDSFNPVSIHASVKDATSEPRRLPYKTASFNPRICKRCDRLMSEVNG